MRETWYVREDGDVADPNECAPDEKGVLRHKSGVAIAISNQTPVSRGVDVAAVRGPAPNGEGSQEGTVGAAEDKRETDKDIRPARHRRGYETREQKAD